MVALVETVDIVCDYGFDERDSLIVTSVPVRSTNLNALVILYEERCIDEVFIEGEYRDLETHLLVYHDEDTGENFIEVSVEDLASGSVEYSLDRSILSDRDEYRFDLTSDFDVVVRVYKE